MSAKRKISLRKILQSVVTLIVMTGCTVAILSATKQQRKRTIKGIAVSIENDQLGFVDKKEVQDLLLTNKNIELSETKVESLDVFEMEKVIRGNPWVNNAQVYVDNDKMLHVQVTQRVPMVRIFDRKGGSYYLDSNKQSIPLSQKYVHEAIVITNVPELKDDSISELMKSQILVLSKAIDNDSFWREQVTQVIVGDDGSFELVPILGKHRIFIGDTKRLDEKFKQLNSFYQNVLNRIGWDKYELLDVRYKGQLVASPSIPWNVPKDKVRNRMNWVSSITGLPPSPIGIPIPKVIKSTASSVAKKVIEDTAKKVVVDPQIEIDPLPKRKDNQAVIQQADSDKQDEVKEKETKEKVIPKYIYQGDN